MNPVNNSDIREHRAQGASTMPDAMDLADEQSPVLELRGISCAYEPNRPAVEQITLTVQQGDARFIDAVTPAYRQCVLLRYICYSGHRRRSGQ